MFWLSCWLIKVNRACLAVAGMPVFEKVAQIGPPNLTERLWMHDECCSSEFFGLF